MYYCKDCQTEYSEEDVKEFAGVQTEKELDAAYLSGIECPTCQTELTRHD